MKVFAAETVEATELWTVIRCSLVGMYIYLEETAASILRVGAHT
jgi:hypothetical protein